MEGFNFKSFYNIYKEALIDDNQTKAVNSLFAPIFKLKSFPNNPRKKDNTLLEIDSKRASEWINDPNRSVRNDVAKTAQNVKFLDAIVSNFENNIVPNELDDYKIDHLIDNMLNFTKHSDLDDEKKKRLQELFDNNEVGEFLAFSFIFALSGEISRQKINATEQSVKSVEEFKQKVVDKNKKPITIVPIDVEETEMGYVNALLKAYEEATGNDYRNPDDVKGTEYEKHFRQQRKNYYQAEAIHRFVRDSETREEEDFDILKEEVEDGIYTVANKQYRRGIDKADAVLHTAGTLPLSHNTENNMLGWVGPGEKRGVCHILVNDQKLTWVEGDENENEE